LGEKMRKIKPENIKVGDFVYLVDKYDKSRGFIIKKILSKKKEIQAFFTIWALKKEPFEPKYRMGIEVGLDSDTLKFYTIYKLNKKEVTKFNKLLILHNLK
jgi:hypothetical protein